MSSAAVIAIAEFIFDDFRTPYSEPIEGKNEFQQPGVVEVTSNNPRQVVIDDLSSGDTSGTRRSTVLDISPTSQAGDLTVFTAAANDTLPPRLSLNADFLTGGRLVTDYDFSPLGESVNAAVDTTHVIIDLVSTDRRESDMLITFRDAHGNVVTRDVEMDLGADLTIANAKAFPFEEFGPIDFSRLTGLTIDWTAGDSYDGEMALIATGIEIDTVPEPSAGLLALLGIWLLTLRRSRQANL